MRSMVRLILFASLFGGVLSAQPAAGEDTLEAILEELRELRETLEERSLLGARVQLAIARLDMQEDRVAAAAAALAAVQTDLRQEQDLRNSASTQVEQLEALYEETLGSDERNELAARIDALKRRAANGLLEEQLRAQESEAAAALAQEQAVLARIQNQIAELERIVEQTR